jgi:hypothetical protein
VRHGDYRVPVGLTSGIGHRVSATRIAGSAEEVSWQR